MATSSSVTLKLARRRWQRRPRRRTGEPCLPLYATNVDVQSSTPGRLSSFLARFRSGNPRQLEQELEEARALILQAERRAELLQSQLEAKLQEEEEQLQEEEEELSSELDKQVTSLKAAYAELSHRLEEQETDAAQKLEEAALQLSASKSEEEAMLKRLQHAEETEKQMETEQKKLITQLNAALGQEQSLQVALKQLRASEAGAQQQLHDAKSQLQQMTACLHDFKNKESREEALSAQLAEAQAGNKLLDERLQETERKLENLLKERQPPSSKGAGKGRGKGKGRGRGRSQ